MKVSIMCDLLIQYMDNIQQDSVLKKNMENLIKDIAPICDAMYEMKALKNNTTVQEIQNKVDTIFRRTFEEIKII